MQELPRTVLAASSRLSTRIEIIVRSLGSSDSETAKSARTAAVAWLGFYNSNMRRLGWGREELVHFANAFSQSVGLPELPAIQKKTLGKMGLKGCPGIKIAVE